jgi:hypothetical protein
MLARPTLKGLSENQPRRCLYLRTYSPKGVAASDFHSIEIALTTAEARPARAAVTCAGCPIQNRDFTLSSIRNVNADLFTGGW